MASITREKKRPLWLTVILLVALLVVGLLAAQWLTSLVLAVVRFVMIVIAIAVMGRIGLFLLRKDSRRKKVRPGESTDRPDLQR